MISVHYQGKPSSIAVSQIYAPNTDAEEAGIERCYEDLQDLLEPTPKKDVPFIIEDWNVKVGSQEIPGITGKFGLRVQNEAGQRLIEFCQENILVIAKASSNNTRDGSTHGHYQMVNTEISLIIFFTAKVGEALCSQQKLDLLGAAQIMNSLLQNSGLK